MLGLAALNLGRFDEAEASLQAAQEALAPAEQRVRGNVLHNRGNLAYRRHELAATPEEKGRWLDQARSLYHQALENRRAAGDARGEAETLGGLGNLALESGDAGEAARLYELAQRVLADLGDTHGVAVMLQNLGEAAELSDDLDTAVRSWVQAHRIFLELHSVFAPYTAGFLERAAARVGAERVAELRDGVRDSVTNGKVMPHTVD
jgi:tetratricopeptide (TPR) repeat protein